MDNDPWLGADLSHRQAGKIRRIRAITKVAHLPTQPRVWSHVAPAIAVGPNTIAISSSALRVPRATTPSCIREP